MKISVVIPAYNVADHLDRCLTSVFSQTVLPDEVIVVDDGSTDETEFVAKKYNVIYHRQNNSGAAVARNKGVELAKFEWIAFLDSDDEWLETKVEKLKKKINQDPSIIMIAHNEIEGPIGGPWVQKDLHYRYDRNKPLFNQLFKSCFLSTSAMSVKRESFLRVKGMDPKLRSSQDYDLWLRLSLIGELVFIPEALSKYILRNGNITADVMKRYKCSFLIIEKHIKKVRITDFVKKILVIHYETFATAREHGQYLNMIKVCLMFPIVTIMKVSIYLIRKDG